MRGAYTLIEILVVIGILVVIAAILFPVFSGVRENGRMAKCISNLHQWGTAIQMYRDDWGGVDPQPGMKIKSLSELGFPRSVPNDAFARSYGLHHFNVKFCPSSPMQELHPLPYTTSFWADAPVDEEDLLTMMRRGSELPLMICTFHNSPPDDRDFPPGGIRAIILRLNQRVSICYRTWPSTQMLW